MDASTQHARETALSLLQPSASQLEHGLALHRDSLVIDAYGFAPRSTVDDDLLVAATQAGATGDEIKELHGELSTLGMIDDMQQQRLFAEAFAAAGVTCIFQNAGEESNDVEILLRRLGRFTHAIDRMPEILHRATLPDDIVHARQKNKHCLYLSANGVPLPRQFRTLEEGIGYIRTFFQLGIRMMHLTYNRRNLIGDGCAETCDGGLSDFGRAVIAEMNRVGVIIDLAHSGVRTGLDAARLSEKPVVISHATCAAFSDHCRAKPDDLIRAVADTDGLIGICCIPTFLQRSGDINALLDHIDHVVQLVGGRHVAIGTDVATYLSPGNSGPGKSGDNTPVLPPRRRLFESFWPSYDETRSATWRQLNMQESLAWTNWPLFTVGLVQRGYRDDDIQNIVGGNLLRVARSVLS